MANQINLKPLIEKVISQISFFQGLSGDARNELLTVAGVTGYQKNEAIFGIGERHERVYLVISGKVIINRKKSDIHQNEILEEMSFFDTTANYAVAAEDCVLFYVPRAEFFEFLRVNPIIAAQVLKKLNLQTMKPNKDSCSVETIASEIEQNKEFKVGIKQETISGDKDRGQQAEEEWFFCRTYACPMCHEELSMTVPRSKYVQVKKTDTDMCSYFRLVDPTFYYIVVCNHCGFSFPEDSRSGLHASVVPILKENLPFHDLRQDLAGVRSIDQAITTYQLAIKCQTLAKAKNSLLGRLNLRLGHLYRKKGNPQAEKECLKKALEHLIQAFTQEHVTGVKAELTMGYLIGELNGRLDNIPDAIQWFNWVTTHPDRKYYRYLVNRSRERWQAFKQAFKEKEKGQVVVDG